MSCLAHLLGELVRRNARAAQAFLRNIMLDQFPCAWQVTARQARRTNRENRRLSGGEKMRKQQCRGDEKRCGQKNDRCNSVPLTRPFRNPRSRCPGSSIGQKALPVAGNLSRRRPRDYFFHHAGSDLLEQRINLLGSSVAHLPVFKVPRITAAEMNYMGGPKQCQEAR